MNWIAESPALLLAVVWLVAFLESFALLGILVPGVVLLFSLSALAYHSGISPLALLVAGGSGALVGDLVSFFIGFRLKNRLYHWSWIARHEVWIRQGEWFFHRWGWLSVIIGRFLGPLRPVIPMVAGTLGMPGRIFTPLCALTALFWAPIYLLPGYYTGELSHLWTLQPLGTRALIIYALTAMAAASGALAIYHHGHPERLHGWGWLTRDQADRWPIPALFLLTLTAVAFSALWALSPLPQDVLFLDWSVTWRNQHSAELWQAATALSDASLLYLEFGLIGCWLVLTGQARLALLATLTFCTLALASSQFTRHYLMAGQAQAFFELTLLVFSAGFLANLINNSKHGLKRWPVYFAASQLMLLAVVDQLWAGRLTLSACGLALCMALFFNSLLKVCWRLQHLPVQNRTLYALLIELLLLNLAILLLAGISNG
ncbi:DedA family protein [Reinekea sp.]|jgi:undecaprenyl-diphosphatase|uniref:DedA family protein n=1 Tax=Reinekea sp. TaxID=1970455 RepID=UPI002A83DDB3|nr:DedA family protein [Reinekea sp.]